MRTASGTTPDRFCPGAAGCPRTGGRLPTVTAAPSTRTRTAPCSARGPARRGSCSSARSPETARTVRASRSSGPAGHLLRRALKETGLDDVPTYLTNAVKHFKFTRAEPGKRRIHKPPSLREMTACRPWLDAELRLVDPEVAVALGATAVRSLLGASFRVTKDRGSPIELPPSPGGQAKRAGRTWVVITPHPSAVLRSDDREAAYADFVADLRVAAEALRR